MAHKPFKIKGRAWLSSALIMLQTPLFIAVIFILASMSFVYISYERRCSIDLSGQAARTVTLEIGGAELAVEIVTTTDQQRRGLSGRTTLAPDAGMLFPIDPPERRGFWMKDMNFTLDFIYLHKGRVVEIKENMQPSLAPLPFFSNTVVDTVVEVNAGWVREHGIRVGDAAGYPL